MVSRVGPGFYKGEGLLGCQSAWDPLGVKKRATPENVTGEIRPLYCISGISSASGHLLALHFFTAKY